MSGGHTSAAPGKPWRRVAGRALPALLLLGLGGGLGWAGRSALEAWAPPRVDQRGLRELREPTHRYVQPLVECDLRRNSPQNRALDPFHEAVDARVRDLVAAGLAADVALYFREFNDGLWFSSGEESQFTPASLRKVPLMIALLKQAERQPGLLDRMAPFPPGQDLAALQNVKPSQFLEPGKEYPVHELIRRMITYSDNDAYAVLMRVVDEQTLREVYGALGAGLDDSIRAQELRSITAYSGFFRVLFNGTYLSWSQSERALALLAKTEFKQGLRAGVPPAVAVAHKFGEHHDAGVYEFHDCGIVYYPEHPYVLCVMTRGKSFPSLVETVASLSQLVYQSIDAQHRQRPP